MELTYEKIKPLIKSERLEGQHVYVEFQAKGQESAIQGIGMIVPEQSDIMKNVGKQAVKSTTKRSLISGISRFIGGFFGGTAGSLASSATSQVGHAALNNSQKDAENMLKVKVTPEKQQKAVVESFARIQQFYKYNESSQEWEAADVAVQS